MESTQWLLALNNDVAKINHNNRLIDKSLLGKIMHFKLPSERKKKKKKKKKE